MTDFNPSEFAGSDFEPIPAGDYDLLVKECKIKASQSGNNYISVTLEVLNAAHKGRLVFDNFNVEHAKSDVRAIAKRQLANLCMACKTGSFNMENVGAVLTNKVLKAYVVVVKDDYSGGTKNKVKKYYSDAQPGHKPAAAQAPVQVPF